MQKLFKVIKVAFSDESNLVKHTNYDGRSHFKSGWHFRFSKYPQFRPVSKSRNES